MFQIKSTVVLLLVLAALWGTSCKKQNILYEHEIAITNESWHQDSIAKFQVEVDNSNTFYNIHITLTNSNLYPRQNIWLFVKTSSTGAIVQHDTIAYYLANEHGKWYGKEKGELWENPLPFKQAVKFKEKGTYTFEIQQGMRYESLPGLSKVGIRIEETDIELLQQQQEKNK